MPDTPSQELREAAKRIRADASWPSEELMLALGDWLDVKAANLEQYQVTGRRDHDYGYALAVARAVLGSES